MPPPPLVPTPMIDAIKKGPPLYEVVPFLEGPLLEVPLYLLFHIQGLFQAGIGIGYSVGRPLGGLLYHVRVC